MRLRYELLLCLLVMGAGTLSSSHSPPRYQSSFLDEIGSAGLGETMRGPDDRRTRSKLEDHLEEALEAEEKRDDALLLEVLSRSDRDMVVVVFFILERLPVLEKLPGFRRSLEKLPGLRRRPERGGSSATTWRKGLVLGEEALLPASSSASLGGRPPLVVGA